MTILFGKIKVEWSAEWAKLKKSSSVWLAAFFAFVSLSGPEIISAWSAMPDDLKTMLPSGTGRYVAAAAFALILIARISRITLLKKKDNADTTA